MQRRRWIVRCGPGPLTCVLDGPSHRSLRTCSSPFWSGGLRRIRLSVCDVGLTPRTPGPESRTTPPVGSPAPRPQKRRPGKRSVSDLSLRVVGEGGDYMVLTRTEDPCYPSIGKWSLEPLFFWGRRKRQPFLETTPLFRNRVLSCLSRGY